MVLDKLDSLLRVRLRGKPAMLGAALLGVLALSLLFFLLAGNGKASRVLYFPDLGGGRLVAEQRLLPRHATMEENATEVAEGVLLGPARNDALRLFPRGGRVIAAFVTGRTLVVDLSPLVLLDDPEVPLKGKAAFDALARSLRFNFPRLQKVEFYVDGQRPRFPGG